MININVILISINLTDMADVIARSHGGDGGGCDPPRGPSDISADCERGNTLHIDILLKI